MISLVNDAPVAHRAGYIGVAQTRRCHARLERRAQDSVGTIEKRLKNARREMDHYNEYDYVLVNEDLELSVVRVRAILASARLDRKRQRDLDGFVRELQDQIGPA